MEKKTIASEFVSYGHPDKIADQIADAILDEYLKMDENTRAGIEVMVKDNVVVLGGEISSKAAVNYDTIVRNVFNDIKFPDNHHLNPDNIKIINLIGKQSPEIHQGVDKSETIIGAGDQGFMVGYASNETEVLMPLGYYIAKKICQCIANYKALQLGPDTKSQVIVDYDEHGNAEISSILVSTMHQCSIEKVREVVKQIILTNQMGLETELFNKYILEKNIRIDINPCGTWNIGGPVSDCGVTGRKLVVDSYGGYCNIGGGNISGKDLSKVDKSAAYMARYLAKNIVASGLCNTAKVELSYMIGIPEPSSINIEMDKNQEFAEDLKQWIKANIDLTPYGIISRFHGDYPRNYYLSKNGHYGVNTIGNEMLYRTYPWEITDQADKIKKHFYKNF